MPSFFTGPSAEPCTSLSSAAVSNETVAGYGVVKMMIVAGATSAQPLVSLCKEISVNPADFLTEEVKGKASILTNLTTMAERSAVYGREKRLYESSCAFGWKTSKLVQLMLTVMDQAAKVKSLMLEVSTIGTDLKLLLMTIGAQSVVKKMALLGDIAPVVVVLGNHLETIIQHLQICNSPICGHGLGRAKGEIRLYCLN